MHEHVDQSQRSLLLTLSITLIILLFEFFGGIFSNSLALLSDSGHMLTDAMSLGLAVLAFYISRKVSQNSQSTYGYYRLEILSALVNGVLLILVASGIFYGAIERFYFPREINAGLMLAVAVVGLIANLASMSILSPHSKENLNIKGAFWHVMSDALSSVGVVFGGLVVLFTGFSQIDPILSIIIGFLVIRGAWGILVEVVHILLESVPMDIKLEDVISEVKKIEGIKDVHHVHIWTITSGYRALSAHIEISDALISQCGGLLDKVSRLLHEKFDIEHSTLQLECESCNGSIVCGRKI